MEKKNKIKDAYPLTPVQEGILFHAIVSDESRDYFAQIKLEFQGKMDRERFNQSFQLLFNRHEILRTAFVYDKVKRPLQVVIQERYSPVTFIDCTNLPLAELEAGVEAYRREDIIRGFDLTHDPLMRLAVFEVAPGQQIGLLSLHHIIIDGWSTGIILKELEQIYYSLLNREPVSQPPVLPFSNYIKWQEKQDTAIASTYWQEYLSGYDTLASLPAALRSGEKPGEQNELLVTFSQSVTDQLVKLASVHQVTLSVLFQAIWGILLQKYNHVVDVVFGAVSTLRPAELPGVINMVGIFINTIPVRVQSSPDTTFLHLVKMMQQAAYKANSYSHYSLAEIQAHTDLKNNLFDHIVVCENYPVEVRTVQTGEPFHIRKLKTYEKNNYELTVEFYPGSECLVKLIYTADHYDLGIMQNIAAHLQKITQTILASPEILLQRIELVSTEERQQLLQEFCGPTRDFPKDKSVYHYIEEIAAHSPERVALLAHGRTMTYREVNEQVNQLSRYLHQHGVKREDRIGVMLDRSPQMVIAIVAIWKVQAAYLPIDGEYPEQRIYDLLRDAQAKLLLTNAQYASKVTDLATEIINLDQIQVELGHQSQANLNIPFEMNQLAYVIYTSGSTGKPKGVMLEHLGMLNHLQAKLADVQITRESVVAQTASHCFDISIWQFFSALLVGGSTRIYPKEISQNLLELAQQIQSDRVTVLQVVPSMLSVLLELVEADENLRFNDLQSLLVTAETVQPHLIEKWFTYFPEIPVINGYGPTEACDNVTHYRMKQAPATRTISIGKPIQNLHIYILNQDLQLCPVGVKGEICISGCGVSRGYRNNPAKTQEVFLEDPFIGNGRRMYRTGDIGRYLPDGTLEFLGRKDAQVKIRGYRIELAEIEQQMVQYPGIKEVVVLARNDQSAGTYLCAYYVAQSKLSSEEIKGYLSGKLPAYMVPDEYIWLEAFPLNTNGKINRKALPAPERKSIEGSGTEPCNDTEKQLAELWKDVLGIDCVGRSESFFAVGGHSLKATQLLARVHKNWDVKFNLQTLFQYPTVAKLSELILDSLGSARIDQEKSIEPLPVQETYQASLSQKRMWLHNQVDGSGGLYTILLTFALEGKLDEVTLRKALEYVVKRHELLHSTFVMQEGELFLKVQQTSAMALHWLDLRDRADLAATPEEELLKELESPFDLQRGPLIRAMVIQNAEQKFVFALALHHLIFDGWSTGVLLHDLFTAYDALISQKEPELPPLRIQYRDYAAWQRTRFSEQYLEHQRTYWLHQLAGALPVLAFPTDYPRPRIKTYAGEKLRFELEEELSRQLTKLSKERNLTLFMTLLTAVNILLTKYVHQDEMIIGTDIAGRTYYELEDLIGLFVNTLPLRIWGEATDSFVERAMRVQQVVLQAYDHQDYPFDQLVYDLNLKRDLSRSPLFDVMVSMGNTGEKTITSKYLTLEANPVDIQRTYFDLLFVFQKTPTGVSGSISYNRDLFLRSSIELLQLRLIAVLKSIVENPELPITELDCLISQEKEFILDVEFDF